MLAKHKIQDQKYDCMVAKIQKGSVSLDSETDPLSRHRNSKSAAADDASSQGQSESVRRFHTSANTLQRVSVDGCDISEYLFSTTVDLITP